MKKLSAYQLRKQEQNTIDIMNIIKQARHQRGLIHRFIHKLI